ncbi:tRNA:m(4)X modification enzyme TRM13 homolog isoform X2 [Portunus trituberculatus]|uniref:tRNA:m(4)X modification enzyme TRM13 homolog isoform X2 n=1 Tax=Portunus trituberculatus TaxID=210409 RepID=UPI001E1CBAF1|nr:tRNA:m(4)X modification enzyme TRM13 homolog isoform X2 [Portunus trituberculatus]
MAAGSGNGGGVHAQKVCGFFLQHKGRPCRMLVKAGRRYCGQHLVEENSEETTGKHKRIPCPLDPKHSCFEHRLDHHLTICNARVVTDLPHLRLNCNLRVCGEYMPAKVSLSSLPDEVLLAFITKLERIHADAIDAVRESIMCLDAVEAVIAECCGSPSMVRHLRQTSSLLAHLKAANLLDTATNSTCYVEFGAGRGQLTKSLTEAVTDISKALFVLIDRGAQRYKYDTKLRYNQSINVKRFRVDIQHLSLEGVEGSEDYQHIVGLGKHLCGSASDLALRCLCQHPGMQVVGVVLALCCHHRCVWDSYCGLEVLQGLGVQPSEFYILTALTGWATCNSKDVPSKEEMTSEPRNTDSFGMNASQEKHPELLSPKETMTRKNLVDNRYTRLNLAAQHREEIGRKAKQVLDYGRMQYMREQGFECSLVQYVAKDTTPENVALIASRVPRPCRSRKQE